MKYLLILVIFVASSVHGQDCPEGRKMLELNINNVQATIINSADNWWDFDYAGYFVPNGSEIPVYGPGALWIGGIDQYDSLRLAANHYRGGYGGDTDFYTGPISNHFPNACEAFDTLWTVFSSEIDNFKMDWTDGILDHQISNNIRFWPAAGNPSNPTPIRELGNAPFFDTDNDGIYRPDLGDHPTLRHCSNHYADQMIWCVYNDLGEHEESRGLPIGVQVEAIAYAYQSNDELNNTTFYDYTFINKGEYDLDSFYIGYVSDPWLGNLYDNFNGCDTIHNMAIAYNGDDYDDFYYLEDIPMTAIKVLNQNNGTLSEMSTFLDFDNDFGINSDPIRPIEHYYFLQGRWRNGQPITFGSNGTQPNGIVTSFMFPDDPTNSSGWSECAENNSPSRRRMLMSSGPTNFNSNDVLRITYAALWVRDSIPHPCPSFQPIQEVADFVQNWYDDNICNDPINTAISNIKQWESRIYPNPFSIQTKLTFPQEMKSKKSVRIYNELGQLIQSFHDVKAQSIQIESNGLGHGIFIYKVISAEGQSVGKFVVQ